LKRIEAKEELRRAERESVLNIQLLAIRSPLHSSSSLECVKGKAYNEKIYFLQTIIQDIDTTETSIVKFLHKRKRQCARKHIKLGATSVDSVFIKELEEDKVV
jgi:hypothetical protein